MKTLKRLAAVLAGVFLVGALAALFAQAGGNPARGDINGDGRVSVADVLALLLAGSRNSSDPVADYNGDGVYSLQDAIDLLAAIVWLRQAVLDVEVAPVETDDFLVNPGMGFVSVHSFNNWVRQLKHPLCSIAQFRWYWDEIEPAEGQIRFDIIDDMISRARANGQKLMFRIMCQDGEDHIPKWLHDLSLSGWKYTDGSAGWQPDYGSPLFKEKHGNLIRALAARYDGHPDIDHVDIGSVGRWGEWHTSETGLNMPADSVRTWAVDLYLENFKKTPLVMLIGGEKQLEYAVAHHTGWRADCLGDYGMFSSTWNHMEDYYQQALDAARANDAWKDGPVVFESCGTIETWWKDGFSLDKIISESNRWHGSVVHLGTTDMKDMPQEWYDKTVEWGKKMGYRFVPTRLAHQSAAYAGGRFTLEMDWENRGVAPIYLRHRLAVRFLNEATGDEATVETDADITGWLPGETSYRTTLTVPAGLPAGDYALCIGMLDPYYRTPRIKFPIQGIDSDGWYRLSRVTVK
ncbi:MAG: DUF4832 domain-containing protein [Candidatus Glassbacteria bacterium]